MQIFLPKVFYRPSSTGLDWVFQWKSPPSASPNLGLHPRMPIYLLCALLRYKESLQFCNTKTILETLSSLLTLYADDIPFPSIIFPFLYTHSIQYWYLWSFGYQPIFSQSTKIYIYIWLLPWTPAFSSIPNNTPLESSLPHSPTSPNLHINNVQHQI